MRLVRSSEVISASFSIDSVVTPMRHPFPFINTVPGPPSDIKAISVDEHTILVSWLDPRAANGRVVMYSVFMKTMESGRQFTQKYEVYPPHNHFSVRGLNQNQPYRCARLKKL